MVVKADFMDVLVYRTCSCIVNKGEWPPVVASIGHVSGLLFSFLGSGPGGAIDLNHHSYRGKLLRPYRNPCLIRLVFYLSILALFSLFFFSNSFPLFLLSKLMNEWTDGWMDGWMNGACNTFNNFAVLLSMLGGPLKLPSTTSLCCYLCWGDP